MKEKILGLDLGLTSVGWGMVEMSDSSGKILGTGARVFPAAEVAKTWESPAKQRREHRSSRRRLRRRALRMNDLRRLFVGCGLLGEEFKITDNNGHWHIDKAKISKFHLAQNKKQDYDLYKLRAAGLERRLEAGEWAALLTQLAKRRGFKSNRKNPQGADKESGVVIKQIAENKKLLDDAGYKTVGQMLAKEQKFKAHKRNKAGNSNDADGSTKAKPEHYARSFLREHFRHEIKTLFERQCEQGNPHSTPEFEGKYLAIWERQRSFDQGNIVEMVGNCPFEAAEKRAPRMSYTAECARVWQDINHRMTMSQQTTDGGRKTRTLTAAEKNALFDKAANSAKVTFADVRSVLKLNRAEEGICTFKGVFYRTEHKQFQSKISHLKIIHSSKDGDPPKISEEQRDKIYRQGFANLAVTYAEIREILKLPADCSVKGTPKNKESRLPDEEKAFYEISNYQKLQDALPEHWGKIHEEDKLAELCEICMFTEGDTKQRLLEAAAGAEVAACLQKTKLTCDDEKVCFTQMQGTYAIRQAAKKIGIWPRLCPGTDGVPATAEESPESLKKREYMDTIAEAVTYYKEDTRIAEYLQEKLQELSFADMLADIKKLTSELMFSETANLSLKALNKILPHLREGHVYSAACEKAGYDHSRPSSTDRTEKLPVIIDKQTARNPASALQEKIDKNEVVLCDIRNPRVLRALSQARKIVNAVVEKYGSPHKVHIELSRDLARSPEERRKILKGQNEFKGEKERARNFIQEHAPSNYKPRGGDILKVRLWQAQGGFCPYSGTYMKPNQLFKEGAFEIDHILPLSRSMDDSQNNKALCLTAENQKKGDRIPHEYFTETGQNWTAFCARVKNYRIGRRERLLKTQFSREDAQEHMKKHVESPESKWISREFKNYLEKYLQFSGSNDEFGKLRIQTRNGTLTAFLRTQWGLAKSRDNHLHHAQDALVLAASTQGMVKRISQWSKKKELYGETDITDDEGEVEETTKFARKEECPAPWEKFRHEVKEECRKIFVSQPARRKMSGEAHEASLEKKASPKRHFVLNNGKHGAPKVWKIRRTDVFQKGGQYYLSMVRGYDIVRGELPKKTSGRDSAQLDENYNFCFSLHPGDAVLIRAKTSKPLRDRFPCQWANGTKREHTGVAWDEAKKIVTIVGYCRYSLDGSAQIVIEAHDKSWPEQREFGITVRKFILLQKLEIPLLGDVCFDDIFPNKKYIVKQEKRRELAKPTGRKPGRP